MHKQLRAPHCMPYEATIVDVMEDGTQLVWLL